MYYTHHFAHEETRSRARTWLTQLGFHPMPAGACAGGVHRLTLEVGPGQLPEVSLVIDAAERSDPDGWPSFWDVARLGAAGPRAETRFEDEALRPECVRPPGVVIGWHPPDYCHGTDTEAEADLALVRELMARWE